MCYNENACTEVQYVISNFNYYGVFILFHFIQLGAKCVTIHLKT